MTDTNITEREVLNVFMTFELRVAKMYKNLPEETRYRFRLDLVKLKQHISSFIDMWDYKLE